MFDCRSCHRFQCTCGEALRLETQATVWQVSRGNGVEPLGPEFPSKGDAIAWAREHVTGFYVVRGH